MILVKPSHNVLTGIEGDRILRRIERAGRTCYKSEDKVTTDSAKKFVASILKREHESVIEHENISVKITCDRGVTHEIVRHRLVAYSQESTRYCNYANEGEIAVVEPFFFDPFEELQLIPVPDTSEYNRGTQLRSNERLINMNSFDVWFLTCLWTQWGYMTLINIFERSPQQARSVLPNSLKTEIVMTANLREWRHILRLRISKAAHPQMREVMIPILEEFKHKIPVLFDDIKLEK